MKVFGGILLLLLVAAIIGAYAYARGVAALTPEERRERHALQAHRRAVDAHQAAIRTADQALRKAESAHARDVRKAQRALDRATALGDSTIASFAGKTGKVKVSATQIKVPSGVFPMNPRVQAAVDTAGELVVSRRPTLTRMAAGGLLFGPIGALLGAGVTKKEVADKRELYLLIEGDEFASLIQCDPDKGQKARQTATAINQAARQSETFLKNKARSIETARKRLREAQGSTAEVEAAQAARAEVHANQAGTLP